ncbi:hypothetical protein GCWU000282_01655 [Catonella morbi ATCC 51271]|uniref:Uncharacterized protein n=1 Tax=Catonella morbi ATCC 51271 TaxID=592026 RepID=V2Z785_9FIRM|nr:hypothetical protein [Catonella morbi]ESL02785.1 hypothetical protein GCWU000282_01655 [Catonella morbi ATCC 51271]
MNKISKYFTFMLAMVILTSSVFSSSVYASIMIGMKKITNTEIIYVEAEKGVIVPVEVTETIYTRDRGFSGLRSITRYSNSPKIGEYRTYKIKVSNEVMGLPLYTSGSLSALAKKKAAKAISAAITKKLGANFIPGLNFVSWILNTVAIANAVAGNKGLEVTIDMKYTEINMHKDGYSVRGWSAVGLSIDTY